MRSTPRPLAVLCILATALAGCFAESDASPGVPNEDPPRLVATRTLEPRTHDYTLPRKLGVLEAAERRQLAFEVSGRLDEIVEKGAKVEPDTVIARLNSTMEAAELRRASAMLSDAQAEWERVQGLSKARAASQKQVDTARIQLEMRDAEHEMARFRLEQRSLRAGIAGTVADAMAEPGELVSPQSAVATVLDTSTLELVIGVPGYQVTQIDAGTRARIFVPAYSDEPLKGTVERVADAALPGQHLFEVEIRLTNPATEAAAPGSGQARALRPGMNAWAELVAESIEGALVVPLQSMVDLEGERVVYFVDDGRAVAFPVGDARVSDDALILPQTTPHRELVVRGQHELRPGDRVRVDNKILELDRAP